MRQVTFAPAAIRDLQRIRDFLRPKNPDAARRAGEAIRQGVRILGTQPRLGRMIDDGYVLRYRIDGNPVTILVIRHQREAGMP